MLEKKITFQLEVLKRHDAHITVANTKSGMILSFSIAFFGVLVALMPMFWTLNSELWYRIALVITVLIVFFGLLASIINSFFAIFPNTSPGAQHSLISFVHTSAFDGGAEAYRQAVVDATDESQLKDLCYQSFVLAQIAEKKFVHIKNAVRAIKILSLASAALILCIVAGSIVEQESNKSTSGQVKVEING